jgi:flagellar basal body-associated protein FliL
MRKQIFSIAGLLLTMFALAYVAALALIAKNQPAEPSKQQKFLYRLPPQVVNLSGTDGKRYLKMELALEYESANEDNSKAILDDKKLVLIDAMLMLLSNKTVASIDGYENKEMLKDEICLKFNKILQYEKKVVTILGVYYQMFLIQ